MLTTVGLAMVVAQVTGLQVSAVADRDHARVGEEVAVTVRATSGEQEPIQFILPSFDGFSLIARTETGEVSRGARPRRSAILELRLRAIRGGQLAIWPIRVQQRFQVVVVPRLIVEVEGDDMATAAGGPMQPKNPEVRRLIARAPPPRRGDVRVATVLSSERAFVGEQVDLATAAWFPRSLLTRLRRPPTLKPPSLEGVWSLPQPANPGVVASRFLEGQWYDLFVSHQVFFPLTAGTVVIPSATLTFVVPEGRQFFSEGKQYELASPPETLTVHSRPLTGDRGSPTARRMRVRYELPSAQAFAGELIEVGVVVEGDGNVALWPEPQVEWPAGVRAYRDQIDEEASVRQGRAGGLKRFHYNLLADSSGPIVLPTTRYAFFDPNLQRFSAATTPSATLPIAPARKAKLHRIRPGLGFVPSAPPLSRLWDLLTPVGGLLLGALPLLWLAGLHLLRRTRGWWDNPADPPAPDLITVVRGLVPTEVMGGSAALEQSLRRRGIPAVLAREVVEAVKARHQERYGSSPTPEPSSEPQRKDTDRNLVARLRQALGLSVVVLVLLAAVGDQAAAQIRTADSLYRSGDVRAALVEYRRQAEASPESTALWYRMGLSAYAIGEDAIAASALLRARRLAPRSPIVQEAWDRLRDSTRGQLQIPNQPVPMTPGEGFAISLGFWLVGWVWILWRGRGRLGRTWMGWGMVGASLVVLGLAIQVKRTNETQGGVLLMDASIRESPHGLSNAVAVGRRLAWVIIADRRGGWRRVRLTTGFEGWVEAEAIAAVPTARR